MGEGSMKGIGAVPVAAQYYWYLILGISFRSGFRMGDVFIIRDTAVFSEFQVVEREYYVGIVPLSDI